MTRVIAIALLLLPILFVSMSLAESETMPEALAASKYTGSYSSAYMPYVPFRYSAYAGGYTGGYAGALGADPLGAATVQQSAALAALAQGRSNSRQAKRFIYGVPAGGLYVTNFK